MAGSLGFIYGHDRLTHSRLEGQPSVTVKVGVGDGAIAWNLPKALLTHGSPFFAAALDGPWLESAANSIEMVEDHPAAFRFYLQWLFAWTASKPGDYPKTIFVELTTSVYLHAWVLGDKLGCPRFQDFAYAHLQAQPSHPRIVKEIYTMTPRGSKLRQYITERIATHIQRRPLKGDLEKIIDDLIIEVEDLAVDIVRYQIHNTNHSHDNYLLVSSWKDFVFPKS